MKSETDHDRLARYAERFFQRHHKEKFPEVRQCARALGWTHQRVMDAVEGDPEDRMYTTSFYATEDPPIGDHFVETWGPDGE